jgi:hypothetical protein
MKELELKVKQSHEVGIKQQKEKKHELIGQIVPHEGHSLFELNIKTKEIKKAQFTAIEKDVYIFSKGIKHKKQVIVNEDCVYISALNKKNAIKHFSKNSNGSIK